MSEKVPADKGRKMSLGGRAGRRPRDDHREGSWTRPPKGFALSIFRRKPPGGLPK